MLSVFPPLHAQTDDSWAPTPLAAHDRSNPALSPTPPAMLSTASDKPK